MVIAVTKYEPSRFILLVMWHLLEKVTKWLILAELFVGNGNCY